MLRSKFLLLYLNVLDLNAEMVSRLENKFGTAFMTWMRGSKCAEWQRKAIR
jgi:plasmid maintenance system antidote protein VapI